MAALMMKSSVAVASSSARAVRVAPKDSRFKIWQPENNKFFETFSFLPPLTSDQIAKQVDYIVGNGWVPALEFASAETAYTADTYAVRLHGVSAGYYDNRYWTMWKLPMFGCTDASQVLKEIAAAAKAFPKSYIRLVAFDNVKQVQITGFLVQRPAGVTDFRSVEDRSTA